MKRSQIVELELERHFMRNQKLSFNGMIITLRQTTGAYNWKHGFNRALSYVPMSYSASWPSL